MLWGKNGKMNIGENNFIIYFSTIANVIALQPQYLNKLQPLSFGSLGISIFNVWHKTFLVF